MRANYQALTAAAVPEWLSTRGDLVSPLRVDGILHVRELSDGNLNLVYLVEDTAGHSVILKQALPHVRVDPTWPVTLERSHREHMALGVHGGVSPAHVVGVSGFDEVDRVIVLESLMDHEVWRSQLNGGSFTDGVARELGFYCADVAFRTSAVTLDTADLREAVSRAINSDMCQITEDLVFTEPLRLHPRNSIPDSADETWAGLRTDAVAQRAVNRARWSFVNDCEALIHADLHTGSVMVRGGSDGSPLSVRVIDAEFACHGPVAFDLGMLAGNLVLAAVRASVLGDRASARWCLDQVGVFLDAFRHHFRALWKAGPIQPGWDEGLCEHLLRRWSDESVLFAGTEVIRRTVGFAKASDIASLDGFELDQAVRTSIRAGRLLLRLSESRLVLGGDDESNDAWEILAAQLGLAG